MFFISLLNPKGNESHFRIYPRITFLLISNVGAIVKKKIKDWPQHRNDQAAHDSDLISYY